jgi:transcriptional regulator NrdR family protein
MIVRSYRTCDICDKKLTTNEDLEKNYLIEPKAS